MTRHLFFGDPATLALNWTLSLTLDATVKRTHFGFQRETEVVEYTAIFSKTDEELVKHECVGEERTLLVPFGAQV